jgi:hypothetical protein
VNARHHRDLIVWQRAMDLVVESYRLSRALPREQLYGLTSQLRRAVVSVAANIAEGNRRVHRRESGSLPAGNLTVPTDLVHQVGKMLTRMIQRLSG